MVTLNALACLPGCNCHGHSETCHFDIARFEATGGVSGGVCDNCRNGRTGPQCEHCQPFFYQDPGRARDDPQACIRTPSLLFLTSCGHLDVVISSSAKGFPSIFQHVTATRPVLKAAVCAIL